MTRHIDRLTHLVRTTRPLKWVTYLAAVALTAVVVCLSLSLPSRADAGAIQAGLTVIAETMGVILGAVLVVTVLVVEQSRQAEARLRSLFPKYHYMMETHVGTINDERANLVERAANGSIGLDEPACVSPLGGPSPTTFRDLIEALSALVSMFPYSSFSPPSGEVEADLMKLGYSEDDVTFALHVSPLSGRRDPEDFLRLVDLVLFPAFLQAWSTSSWTEFVVRNFEEYGVDGVHSALGRLKTSRVFLGSKTLAAALLVPTLTMVVATMTTLVTTTPELLMASYPPFLVVTLGGYFAGILLAVQLVGRMLR